MKELPYFKFYCSEWINGNITLESLEVQGLFINICVWYWSRECDVDYDLLIKKFRYNSDLIDDLLRLELIKNQNGKIKITFLDEQLKERRKIAKRNKANGLKGGRPKTQSVSSGLAKNNPNITNIEEKRREEKRGENNKEKIDNKKQVFDRFRVLYPGSKRGLDVEFENFQKKNKDWQTVVMDLEELLRLQITKREAAKVAGAFVPQWKNLSTYINQKCWSMEENFEVPQQVNSIPQQQSQYQKTLDDWILSSKPTNAQIAAIERKLAEQPLIPPEALYNAFKRELRNEAYPDLFKIIEKLKKTHKPMSEAERKQKEEFAEMQRRDREAGRI